MHPRLMIGQCLGHAVVEQAPRNPEEAPLSPWPGGLLHAHLGTGRAQGTNPAFQPPLEPLRTYRVRIHDGKGAHTSVWRRVERRMRGLR